MNGGASVSTGGDTPNRINPVHGLDISENLDKIFRSESAVMAHTSPART